MKKTMTRIISLMLAVITVFGLMTAPASAASGISVSDSASTVKVDTSGGKFYVVKTDNAKIRTKASLFCSTYGTYTKGSLILSTGTSTDYIKTKLGGTTYYIHKNDVKKAGSTFSASVDYTVNTKNSAVRTGPAAKAAISYKLAKGTAFLLCGSMKRADNGNLWLVVYTNNKQLNFLYSGNSANICTQVKLTVSAPTNTVNTSGTLQLKASYSPSALTNSITWTSSNPNVATVNAKGVVTGVSAGTATITATVDGLNGAVSVSTDITVSHKITLDVPVIRQYNSEWKNKYIANSNATIGKYGCLLTSATMVYSYDTGKKLKPTDMDDLLNFTSGGALYWDSLEELGYYRHGYGTKVTNSILSTIYAQLKQGNPVIVGGKNSKNSHYIVVTGYVGPSTANSFKSSDFTIADPGNSNRTTLQHFLNDYSIITSLIY